MTVHVTRTTYAADGKTVVHQVTGEANLASVGLLRSTRERTSTASMWAAIFSMYSQLNPAVRITVDLEDGTSIAYTQNHNRVTPPQENQS